MIVEKITYGQDERKLIYGMINQSSVLGRIVPLWDGKLFSNRTLNRVGDWCVEHWKRYHEPPKKAIESYCRKWGEESGDLEGIQIVGNLLEYIEQEEQDNNSEHLLDLAGNHFNRIRLTRLVDEIKSDLDTGNIDEAQGRVTRFHRIELGIKAAVQLSHDNEAMGSTYGEDTGELLCKFKGDLGDFFVNTLERDCFVSFCAPQKTGKSWWLQEVAWQAMIQRNKVAYFVIGDLSEKQTKDRFLTRWAKWPSRSSNKRAPFWPCVVKIPTGILPPQNQDDISACVNFKEKAFTNPFWKEKNWEKQIKSRVEKATKSNKCLLRISCHPNLSISIIGIRSLIEAWELDGFTADVVVIDYADNLSPSDKKEEGRDRINTTWKLMRALAMERKCLVVTATQVNAAGFGRKILGRENFSEDNRKLSHVSDMIGINVYGKEKEQGVCRLNYIVKRVGDYAVNRVIHVASCLSLANPAVCSSW